MNDVIASSALPLREVAKSVLLAQAPPDETRRPIVIVLGMHRSGTSLCSHVLSALGIDMADKAGPGDGTPTPDNANGHWERWEITDLHDRVLGLLNRDYWTPTHDFGMPVAWWADPQIAVVRREIAEFLKCRMGDALFGFKDPRTVRLMPLWHQLARELQLKPKLILCLRNPAQVARSLLARDRVDTDIGEARWFSYVLDFFRYNRNHEFCLIEYEHWFEDVSINLNKLRNFLDLSQWEAGADLEWTASGIVDAELRHDSGATAARSPVVRSLYELSRRSDRDAAALQQIDRIVTQFVGFQQLQGGIQRRFEEIASRAAHLREVQLQRDKEVAAAVQAEAAAAELQASLTDREAMLAGTQQQVDAANVRIQKLAAEVEGAQQQLTAVTQQRDQRAAIAAQAEAEAAELRASLIDREAVLVDAQQRVDAADVRIRGLVSEVERARQELTAIAQQRDEWAGVAAAAQAQNAELRGSLTDREAMLAAAHEGLGAAEAGLADARASAEAQLSGLRRTLAQREQELAAATSKRDSFYEQLAASVSESCQLLQALHGALLEPPIPPTERWYHRLGSFRKRNRTARSGRDQATAGSLHS